jgi:hypothetical protein
MNPIFCLRRFAWIPEGEIAVSEIKDKLGRVRVHQSKSSYYLLIEPTHDMVGCFMPYLMCWYQMCRTGGVRP